MSSYAIENYYRIIWDNLNLSYFIIIYKLEYGDQGIYVSITKNESLVLKINKAFT